LRVQPTILREVVFGHSLSGWGQRLPMGLDSVYSLLENQPSARHSPIPAERPGPEPRLAFEWQLPCDWPSACL
jgi:hypothetical protein